MFDQSRTKVARWNIWFAIILSSALVLITPSSAMPTPVPSKSRLVGPTVTVAVKGQEGLVHPQPQQDGSHSRSPKEQHKDNDNDSLVNRPAKFINPCRIPAVQKDDDGRVVQTLTDVDLFHNIVTQSHKTLKQAKEFVNDFYKDSFGTDLRESGARDRYDDVSYQFLVNVTSQEDSGVGVVGQIRFSYETLQRFAVGLEAIVLDQARYEGGFLNHFTEAEYQLKFLLCELQIAMLEKGIATTGHEGADAGAGVAREIMAQEHRDIEDKTTRDVRDYVILKDYIKTLERVQKTFQEFHKSANSRKSESEAQKTQAKLAKYNTQSSSNNLLSS